MATIAPVRAAEADEVAEVVRPSAVPLRPGLDVHAVCIWVLSGTLVLYLGIRGGGYDLVVRSDAGVVVWWIVLVGALFGVLPMARLSRLAWLAVGLFGAFLVWSAIAATWSLSSERSLQEVSRLACYFGVLALALATYGNHRRALRHTVGAVASALVVIIGLALVSRLRPGTFPTGPTPAFLPSAGGRLGWPLEYWNALAAMAALAIPLLLSLATSARRIGAQAAAAAAIPAAALCEYLTFSRGGAIATFVALVVFLTLAPARIPKFATILVAAAGSAAVIVGASHDRALEHGLTTFVARQEAATLTVTLLAVCVLVAVAQVTIGLAARHAPRRQLKLSRSRSLTLLSLAVLAAVMVLIAVHAPARVLHGWQDFKGAHAATATQTAIGRYGTLNGEGRYQYWKAAIDAMPGHWTAGWGPGSFQFLWLPRAPFWSYVINAHSLYVETLAEVGLVGLALLIGFLLIPPVVVLRAMVRRPLEGRTPFAAVAAAWCAFMVAAAVDWVWQMPVIPVVLLLLTAAALVPERPRAREIEISAERGWRTRWPTRAAIIGASAVALLAIGVPLAYTNKLRQSQAAARAGNGSLALADARAAARVEPSGASAQLQVALVLELEGRVQSAVLHARAATVDEPGNWQTWLIRSRIEAEAGQPARAVAAYRRARSLNPESPIFHS